MKEQLSEKILASIQAAEIPTILALLEENHSVFLNPIDGVILHAKALYYAIKSSKQEVIRFLLNLPVSSDVAFFKYCGHTPLSLAIEEGSYELLPLLLAKTDKNFALHMAVKLNLARTKNFLLSRCNFKKKLLQFLGVN